MFSSVARLCTCGEFRPQGPRKATVMAPPLPIRPGKVSALAETSFPPIKALGQRLFVLGQARRCAETEHTFARRGGPLRGVGEIEYHVARLVQEVGPLLLTGRQQQGLDKVGIAGPRIRFYYNGQVLVDLICSLGCGSGEGESRNEKQIPESNHFE